MIYLKYYIFLFLFLENNDKIFKSNLIMTIDNSNVIYYEIFDESTIQKTFLNLAQNLVNKLKTKFTQKYVLVLDNLSSHKTQAVKKCFQDIKINALNLLLITKI